jgi:YebC/PmpR family DNA-binding regulatory protein
MGRAFEYRRAAKEKRWDKMSRVFPKLAKAITLSAKESGIDPEMNPRLRSAILNAKAQNMPKDNIENAIKRATGNDVDDYTEITYEGKGPHGVLVFIECTTDNTTRSVANVRSYFNKIGGAMVPNGSLEFMFDRKAVIEFVAPEGMEKDDLELELIDAGMDDLEYNEENHVVYGDYTNFGKLSDKLESLGAEIKKANLERIPNSPVEFTDEQLVDIEKLLDKLDDDDDVQAVYNNIA